jgi:hypothetical protein
MVSTIWQGMEQGFGQLPRVFQTVLFIGDEPHMAAVRHALHNSEWSAITEREALYTHRAVSQMLSRIHRRLQLIEQLRPGIAAEVTARLSEAQP